MSSCRLMLVALLKGVKPLPYSLQEAIACCCKGKCKTKACSCKKLTMKCSGV